MYMCVVTFKYIRMWRIAHVLHCGMELVIIVKTGIACRHTLSRPCAFAAGLMLIVTVRVDLKIFFFSYVSVYIIYKYYLDLLILASESHLKQ